MQRNVIAQVLLVLTFVGVVRGADSEHSADLCERARIRYAFQPDASTSLVAPSERAPVSLAETKAAVPFGTAESWRLNIHGGYGFEVKRSDNRLALLGAGLSYFIIDDISLDLELNAMHFDQRGRDAFGGNLNLLFRWHFFVREQFTLYFDGGAGILLTTRDVPSHGSSFNFTPQAGGGFTYEIAPDVRLFAGLRWHHISNANTYRENPGRDSLMGYAGISLPF